MKSLRFLALAFVFCMDVRVRAHELDSCLVAKNPCAVSADTHKVLKSANLTISMARASLLEQRGDQIIRLVIGQFYVETKEPRKLQTPFAKIWCEGECKGLFARESADIHVKSLKGRWLFQRTGETQVYVIPAGLQVEVGEVSSEGRAQMGFPQSLPWTSTVTDWAALYPRSLKEFKVEVSEFRPLWKDAVEAASAMHQDVVQRTVASFEKAQAVEQAKVMAREREDESLRRMFREKNP